MNRIDATFQQLAKEQRKALVGFITAGDPTLPVSLDIAAGMCRAGLDVLELGVPFSDPTADGPVIQRSSRRALDGGMTIGGAIRMAGCLRKEEIRTAIVLFSYYNPILAYGVQRFYDDAVANGVDGVLVVDLPPEESEEMTSQWPGNQLSIIRLIAPTTPPDRAKTILKTASGFVYLISMTGVTGGAGWHVADVADQVQRIQAMTSLPVCVGFGISTPDHVREMSRIADGVVIGSAFERTIENLINDPGLASRMARQVEEYVQALPGGSDVPETGMATSR